jgi:hypothetical protein
MIYGPCYKAPKIQLGTGHEGPALAALPLERNNVSIVQEAG